MKIIVTGANGFLAQHLCLFLADKGFEVFAASRGECRIPPHLLINYHSLELTNGDAVQKYVSDIRPDVLIHAAAMSKPDECHLNREECILQNVTVTQYLLEAVKDTPAHFIYVSTDFIFGEDGPHSEEDIPEPLNFYGESKWMAEKLVQANASSCTTIRPVFIYGEQWDGLRPGFIQWVQQSLLAGKHVKIVDDQWRTPTYAGDICAGIETIIRQKKYGSYHLAGKDILSPYKMAVTVAKLLKISNECIEKVDSSSFPEPVRRAKKSGLKIQKAIEELNYQPLSFEEGVRLSFKL